MKEHGQDFHSRHPVMTPEMIRQLPAGYALVIRGGQSPVIARLPMVWKDPAYRQARRARQAIARLTACPRPSTGTSPTPSPTTSWNSARLTPPVARAGQRRHPLPLGRRAMTTPHDDETLTAALVQISGHAERIAALDDRYRDLADALSEIADRVAATSCPRRQRRRRDRRGRWPAWMSWTTRSPPWPPGSTPSPPPADDAIAGRASTSPCRAPRWWKITGPERDAALDRLRAWVSHVYRPSYGQLAALLPACWEEHPLCLYILDWLSELWSVLYLAARAHPRDPRRPGRMADPAPARRRRPDGRRGRRMPARPADPARAAASRSPHRLTRPGARHHCIG